MQHLDLGLIGNGSFGALIDPRGRVVWGCLPAFDGDPAFCALLRPRASGGDWTIELEDFAAAEQHYLDNTAVLRTLLHDSHGGAIEITRLRAALAPVRPLLPPGDAGAPRAPALRQRRASACACGRWPTGARACPNAPGAATTCASCCRG